MVFKNTQYPVIRYHSVPKSPRMAAISLPHFSVSLVAFNTPSTHKLKPFTTVLPKPSRRRRVDLMLTKASTTQSTARRTNNYHPNLWDDDFIASLEKAYEANSFFTVFCFALFCYIFRLIDVNFVWLQSPIYVERAETMISEVKEIFNGISSQNSSVHQRLSMVDSVERLGIDRHFQKEIKEALDYVYRHWNEKGGAWADLNTTALALRILRLHRYGVSSGGIQDTHL